MKNPILTPDLCIGIISGALLYVGLRSLAALVEELHSGFNAPIALGPAIFSSLLLPLGLGLVFRKRIFFLIVKIYAWVFVVGNSVLIPFHFTDALPTAMKTAATIATWITMIFLLFLIHRRDVANEFSEQKPRPIQSATDNDGAAPRRV